MAQSVYFSAPRNSLRTQARADAKQLLAEKHGVKYDIIDPFDRTYSRARKMMRFENRGKPLSERVDRSELITPLLQHANALAYLPLPNGGIAFDTAQEIRQFLELHPQGTLFEIDLTTRRCERAQTPEASRIIGKHQMRQHEGCWDAEDRAETAARF